MNFSAQAISLDETKKHAISLNDEIYSNKLAVGYKLCKKSYMTSGDQFQTYYKPEEWQRCHNKWDEYIDFRDKRRRKKHDYENPMFARYHPNPHWLPYYNWFWFVEHLFTRKKTLLKDIATNSINEENLRRD